MADDKAEGFNYYKSALEVLKRDRKIGLSDGYAESIMIAVIELAGEKDVNGWFHYGKPREKGKLEDVLLLWMKEMHRGLRQIDMFDKGRGALDGIMWNALWLSERWEAIFEEIVAPALEIEKKVA